MAKIFVNICSYRDKLLAPTICSLLETESGRNQITYGIFEQTKLEDSLQVKYPEIVKNPKVRYKRIDPEFSDGVVWARCINSMQIYDEEFQYQIDSHMLFDKDWDHQLILDYNHTSKLANTKKVLLTSGTKNFDLDGERITKHTLTDDITVKLGYFQFDKNLRLHAHGPWVPSTEVATPSIHICAGNFFAPVSWIKDVGYNTNIFFEGEEQMFVITSIVAGYQIFHHRKIKVYHYLKSSNHESKQTINPVANPERLKKNIERSEKELVDYIYSLDEAQLERYRKITGVDYINRKLENRAISRGISINPGVTNDWEIPDRGD
jgi:hypothetical protein